MHDIVLTIFYNKIRNSSPKHSIKKGPEPKVISFFSCPEISTAHKNQNTENLLSKLIDTVLFNDHDKFPAQLSNLTYSHLRPLSTLSLPLDLCLSRCYIYNQLQLSGV